mmetsp:Transcript_3910/g.9116  ORF Transcript_3910/g.9116 Transcript_3910/m.9116 type:complete len:344 (-) Transcript_3910:135-1166(-)
MVATPGHRGKRHAFGYSARRPLGHPSHLALHAKLLAIFLKGRRRIPQGIQLVLVVNTTTLVGKLAALCLLALLLELALARGVDGRKERGDVVLDNLQLRLVLDFWAVVVREQVGGHLVVDEELHQVLGQPDLLGEAVRREVQHLLHLRLDLDDAEAKKRARELHLPEGLCKGLLLWRQRGNGVCKLFWRRHGLQHKGHAQVIAVFDDECSCRLEAVRREHPTNQQHEARELPRTSHQRQALGRLVGEAMHDNGVEVGIPREAHLHCCAERNAHGLHRHPPNCHSLDGHRSTQGAATTMRWSLDADGALWGLTRAPHRIAESTRPELGSHELPVVEVHVLRKVG